jgi:predicted RNA-binding Zn ribbon-like protein
MIDITDLPDHSRGATTVVAPRRDLCLDFANTVAWRGSEVTDSLHDIVDLLRWSQEQGVIDSTTAARFELWGIKDSTNANKLFEQAIVMRESIYRIFFALARTAIPVAHDIAILNAALRNAPLRHTLAAREHGFGWLLDLNPPITAALLLAPVLWSTGDLLVSPEVVRLRHCANPKCLWLFLDDSKNGSRRWCSMQACGNRAKAHRHYLRLRAP